MCSHMGLIVFQMLFQKPMDAIEPPSFIRTAVGQGDEVENVVSNDSRIDLQENVWL